MKFLGTGLSGMLGSSVVKLLEPRHSFENLSLEIGVDITKPETVEEYISKSDAEWVLHFAAIADVDAAEKDKELKEKGITWKVNVDATQTLVDMCKKYNKKLLYISTDFVFPGGEKIYTEEDNPDPIGWYAVTKFEGEKRVQSFSNQSLIVRLSFPYGAKAEGKKDFVEKICLRLSNGDEVIAPTDQIFVPTFLGDIAEGIEYLCIHNASGIFHLVGSSILSSYEASLLIADVFGYNKNLVKATTAKEFYLGRAPRAFQLRIIGDKIKKLGLTTKSFEEGLRLLKETKK